jgi:hypothetical protein
MEGTLPVSVIPTSKPACFVDAKEIELLAYASIPSDEKGRAFPVGGRPTTFSDDH